MTFVRFRSKTYDDCKAWSKQVSESAWTCKVLDDDSKVAKNLFNDVTYATKEQADRKILDWINDLIDNGIITGVRVE